MKPIHRILLMIPLLLIAGLLTVCCWPHFKHADHFYDIGWGMDRKRVPLIKPIDMTLFSSPEAWTMKTLPGFKVDDPGNEYPYYYYAKIHLVEKIAIQDGFIMVYSPYIDADADTYIQANYYHWFVMVPANDVSRGFHTEEEFNQYIETLGIKDPDWQSPDEVYRRLYWTGCLDWIPGCK